MKNEVKANIKNIIQAKEQNRLVIFAGAGISRNSDVPSWGELIEAIKAQNLTIPNSENDYLKIAQLFYNYRGNKEYYDSIKKILLHKKAKYNLINEAILSLNPEHIITTNYDDLFEQVIKKDRLNYDIIRQNSDFPKTTLSTYLIKMHGCFETENIVLTEDDYLKYSENFPLVESYIKGLFASRLILFIGFGFSDINLKYILQRVDSVLGKDRQPSYIYIDSPFNDLEKNYLFKKGIIPIYFDEIKDYLNDNGFEETKLLQSRGNNLFRFVNLIKEPKFDKDEFKELTIIKQLSKAIKPFEDFGFIMPNIYQKFPPFDEKNPSLNDYDFGYDKTRAGCINIQNQSLIDFFEKLTRTKENEKRSIDSLKKIELELDGANINDRIKDLTNGIINNETEYAELEKVIKALNRSRISCINSTYYIWVEDIERKCNCLSCRFERLEFDKIIEILYKIEFKNEDISNSDDELSNRLLKGYIASKMGFVKIGYEEFQKVMDLSKNQDREISYFLAKYNTKYLLRFSESNSDRIFLREVGKKINLKDLLNGIKVINDVREELDSIISDKYIYEYMSVARKMRDKIIDNYKRFKDGGYTSGNYEDNVYTLITNLLVIDGFYRINRIIDTEFNLFSEFTEICFEGIIYNYITPNPKRKHFFGEYRKIERFQVFILQSVILYCEPDKLHEILEKLGSKKIKISDKEKEDFIQLVVNFYNSFYKISYNGDIEKNDMILQNTESLFSALRNKSKRIAQNLILLLGSVELEDIDFNKTIDPFIHFLSVQNFDRFDDVIYWQTYLSNNLERFTEDQKERLLLQILTKNMIRKERLFECFSTIIQKQGIILFHDLEFIKSLINKKSYELRFLIDLFPISNEQVQEQITKLFEKLLEENFNSVDFYKSVGFKILSPERFLDSAVNEAKLHLTSIFDFYNFELANFLFYIGLNNIDTNNKKFEEFITNNKYINWLFLFDRFDYSEFENQWFENMPTIAFLPKMFRNETIRQRFEMYLKKSNNSEQYERLSKLYFEYFVES